MLSGHFGIHDVPLVLQNHEWYGLLAFTIMCVIIGLFYLPSYKSNMKWFSKFMINRYSASVDLDHLIYKKHEMPCTSGKLIPSLSFMGGGHLWTFALGM
jgi:hypothetical protein